MSDKEASTPHDTVPVAHVKLPADEPSGMAERVRAIPRVQLAGGLFAVFSMLIVSLWILSSLRAMILLVVAFNGTVTMPESLRGGASSPPSQPLPPPDPVSIGHRLTTSVDGQSITLSFLYCHQRGTPEAEEWLRSLRSNTSEDKQSALKPIKRGKKGDGQVVEHSPLSRWRHSRCLSAYCMPPSEMVITTRSVKEANAMKPDHSLPLVFTALLDPSRLPAKEYHARLLAAARALSTQGLYALNPNVTRFYYHGASDQHVAHHMVATDGLPGRFFYRVAILGDDGVIRLRPLDHHALVIILEYWWRNVTLRARDLKWPALEQSCICPAHLGILGSGMHISHDTAWRIYSSVHVERSTAGPKTVKGWAEPMPTIHAFPATLDEAFLADIGATRGTRRRFFAFQEKSALLSVHDVRQRGLSASTIRVVDKVEGDQFERSLRTVNQAVPMPPPQPIGNYGEDDEDEDEDDKEEDDEGTAVDEEEEEEEEEPIQASRALVPYDDNPMARLKAFFGLIGRGCGNTAAAGQLDALAIEIPLTTGMAEHKTVDESFIRCYRYCQRYEAWLLDGFPRNDSDGEKDEDSPEL